MFELFKDLVKFGAAREGVVAVCPVIFARLDVRASLAGQILLRIDAGSGGVHLHIREEPSIRSLLVRDRVAAEEETCVVLDEFGFDANLLPPIADERLRVLSDGVGGGLVGNSQWNAIVLTDAVTVSIQHAVVVE